MCCSLLGSCPSVPDVPPVLGFVLLGLEVRKPHSCFANCSLCQQRGRWRETARLEEEARKGCFLSASCSCRPHPNSPSSSWQSLLLLPFGPSLGAFNRQNQPYYAPHERRQPRPQDLLLRALRFTSMGPSANLLKVLIAVSLFCTSNLREEAPSCSCVLIIWNFYLSLDLSQKSKKQLSF